MVAIRNPTNAPHLSNNDIASSPPIIGTYPVFCFPDWPAYVALYPELTAARVDGATHFAEYGANGGRNLCVRCGGAPTGMVKCGKWDDDYYLRIYPDVRAVYPRSSGLIHFKTYRYREGRSINLMPSESASVGHYIQ